MKTTCRNKNKGYTPVLATRMAAPGVAIQARGIAKSANGGSLARYLVPNANEASEPYGLNASPARANHAPIAATKVASLCNVVVIPAQILRG